MVRKKIYILGGRFGGLHGELELERRWGQRKPLRKEKLFGCDVKHADFAQKQLTLSHGSNFSLRGKENSRASP